LANDVRFNSPLIGWDQLDFGDFQPSGATGVRETPYTGDNEVVRLGANGVRSVLVLQQGFCFDAFVFLQPGLAVGFVGGAVAAEVVLDQ